MAACAAVALAGCGDSGSPVGTTQWQVSSIFTGADRPSQLPDSLQGRSFVVFGRDSFTGMSGCYHLSGGAQWNPEHTELRVDEVSIRTVDGADAGVRDRLDSPGGPVCIPGDEDTAQRLATVLQHHTLRVERPRDGDLRLTAVQPDAAPWSTPLSVEFISTG